MAYNKQSYSDRMMAQIELDNEIELELESIVTSPKVHVEALLNASKCFNDDLFWATLALKKTISDKLLGAIFNTK